MIDNLEHEGCLELLRNNYFGRLTFIKGETPYVVPITYYFQDEKEQGLICYSLEGFKIEAMRENGSVALLIDEIESIFRWKSVLVHGQYEELSGTDARIRLHEFTQGIKAIINRGKTKNVRFINEFSSKMGALGPSPIVFRINMTDLTGKIRQD